MKDPTFDALAEPDAERARLATAQAIATVGSWETDLATMVVTWSDETHRIFGSDRLGAALTHGDFLNRVHPDDRSMVDQAFQGSIGVHSACALEHRLLMADGRVKTVEERWQTVFDQDGRAVRVLGTCQDVTDRQRVQDELALQSHILEHIGQAVIATDQFGRITYANRHAGTLYGWSPTEIIGRSITEVTVPADAVHHADEILALLAGGGTWSGEFVVQRRDGTTFLACVTDTPLRDAQGEIRGFVGISEDVSDKKRIAEALAELSLRTERRERLLNTTLSSISDFTYIYDKDVRFLFVNQPLLDLWGLTLEQVVGRNFADLNYPPELAARLERQVRQVFETSAVITDETPYTNPSGATGYYEYIFSPVMGADGEVEFVAGATRDVTERRTAEIEIARINRALQMLSSCSDALIRADDEQALRAEVCRLAVDLGGYRMVWVGYAQHDAVRSVKPMAHAGHDHGYLSAVTISWDDADPRGHGPSGRVIRTGRPVVIHDVAQDPDFQPWLDAATARGYRGLICLPLRDGARTFGVLALYSSEINPIGAEELELLERMADNLSSGIGSLRARERVREQAALLDIAHEAIIERNLDDRIVYWNKGAEQTYGWSAADAIGRRSFELLGHDAASFAAAQEGLRSLGAWEGELTARTRDGRDIVVEERWTLVRHPDGRPRSVFAINTDVTAKKQLHAHHLRAQRMDSIGTLTAGIAHDLNNVLAPILLSVEMLADVVTTEEDRELLTTLHGSAQRGADLVRQLLSFTRGVEGERITVSPLRVMNELLSVMRDTFAKSIEVRFTPAPELWTVTGDPTQLHQVFMNLCVNARDAMPAGGRLSISMTNVLLDESDTLMDPAGPPGPYVLVKVEDSGTGIAPAVRDRMFEPFFTTKELGKGTGLGLSTTLAIVKGHGGFIQVYSEPGKGTAFAVYLAANATQAAADTAPSDPVRLPMGEGELILVVDDEEAIRRAAQRTLERFGYRTLLARDGAEAILLYTRRRDEIALVLTDMMMPGVDGSALIAALMALNPAVRIIGSSGLASGTGVAAREGVPGPAFVPKPYTAQTLLRKLREVLYPAPREAAR